MGTNKNEFSKINITVDGNTVSAVMNETMSSKFFNN